MFEYIKNGLTFGNEEHNTHFVSFFIKCLAFVIPAIVLGIVIDLLVYRLQVQNKCGKHLWTYITLQFLINIILLYMSLKVLNVGYANEFQTTIPGMWFSTILFGVQIKWFKNIENALYPESP